MTQTINEPLVVICMATYNPPVDLFAKQIESIINQTFQNWVCIINDDNSDEEIYSEIQKIASKDKRFSVYRNESQLGFYYNFEKCLFHVPQEAEFVGFADQDDYWHKEKLEKTLAEFDSGTNLVFCDMNIVDRDGKILYNTYWTKRENNFENLAFLLFANTVTGAASLFRKNLLDFALPFPERIGDSYHDWWIACIALLNGKIKFINKPLYDYRQHEENVLGHFTGSKSAKKTDNTIPLITRFTWNYYSVFMNDFLRVVLSAKSLKERCPNAPKEKLEVVNEIATYEKSISKLLFRYLQSIFHKKITLGAEGRLLKSYIVTKMYKQYVDLNKNKYQPSQVLQSLVDEKDSYSQIREIEKKIAPLNLKVSSNVKKRVNIIIPTIDFRYFFAGYISKFNFADNLAGAGENVRLVIVDWCDFQLDEWKKEIGNYSGLENFFENIEVSYAFDRKKQLEISQDDVFVATTWWTAYIANEARDFTKAKKFLYLIQEYEPFTFPHGSYFALAEESYNFPHYAIFSTEFLREYFKQNKKGVFKDNITTGEAESVSFQNAIVSLKPNEQDIRNRDRFKLLFYARPEQHASRNMFEMGILALSNAVKNGIFDDAKWEFVGLGSIEKYHNISLPKNFSLKILPRVSLKKYKEILPSYDLGISLMLTPHPNLITIEMSSAGMITVTNSFENKTQTSLSKISQNIISADPTIKGIEVALAEAVKKIKDYDERIKNSKVNWPTSWKESFNEKIMEKVSGFLQNT